jgi:hypothetical protein
VVFAAKLFDNPAINAFAGNDLHAGTPAGG